MNPYRSRLASGMGLGGAVVLSLWAGLASVAVAHETDQFTMPVGRSFADLRFHYSDDVRRILTSAVRKTNAAIERSLRDGQPTATTARHQSPDAIAYAVLWEFPPVINQVERLNLEVLGAPMRARYPGLVVGDMPVWWIYHHWALLLDVTKLVRLGRSATIMIDGVYLGTDKIAHFAHMGYLYFAEYRRARAAGQEEHAATRRAIELGTGSNLLLSENTLLGMITTGVRSNADLVANYCGFKFYRNLTEAVSLRGKVHPPMLVQDGPFWKLNDHVAGRRDFFSVFVSDHWNEALNANTYVPFMDVILHRQIRRDCHAILDWYRDDRGHIRTRADFLKIAESLRTYFGEEYGFEGDILKMANIANCCFDSEEITTPRQGAVEHKLRAAPATRDRFGRNAVWHAARAGRLEELRTLLEAGVDADLADVDGETPLHAAARNADTEIVTLLLEHGVDANPASAQGWTPLHFAVREGATPVVDVLIRHGAGVNARDAFGRAPLHDAVLRDHSPSVERLLLAGADANALDDFGNSPLHIAVRQSFTGIARRLLDSGSDPCLQNALGRDMRAEVRVAGIQAQSEILAPRNCPPADDPVAPVSPPSIQTNP